MVHESSTELLTDQPEVIKRQFDITVDDQCAFLTVYPSEGVKPALEPIILAALKEKAIEKFDYPLVVQSIKAASGLPVKIYTSPVQLKDPSIQVVVERDRMEAFIVISSTPQSRQPTTAEIFAKIEAAGIRFGVDAESVKRACQQPGFKMTVATGLPPVDGQDAQIVYLFNVESKGKPVENDDGSVDYKNISLFTTVSEGDILAEKLPPIVGKPGIDVLGNQILPKLGRDIPLPLGKNVVDKGGKVVASISGQVIIVNSKIHIIPVIVVNGDVDFSSGNIEFTGNVTIKGSIQPGFFVKADGDIEILGTVCGGVVEGRNVTIRMGIQGMFRGHVKAQKNVYAKFIENSTVYAGQEVHVSDVILHSRISAGNKVIVDGRRGLIVGGQITAGDEIRAKVAGTSLAIATDLEVGVNPVLRVEYQALRHDVRKVETTLTQTQKSLAFLRSMDQSSLPQEKQELLLKVTKAQFQLAGQAETMNNRILQIEQELDQLRQGRIRIADEVFPGVKIVVGNHVKPVRERLRYVTFTVEDGEMKIGVY